MSDEEVECLGRWLEDVGFAATKDAVDEESFGNVLLEFQRADVCVRIACDRGDWLLTVRSATSDWADMGLWVACLDGVRAPLTLTAFHDEVLSLRERVDEIEQRALDVDLADCLRKQGRTRTVELIKRMRRH